MLDFLGNANQMIELTCQSWLFDKNSGCSNGQFFVNDAFVNHTPTKLTKSAHRRDTVDGRTTLLVMRETKSQSLR